MSPASTARSIPTMMGRLGRGCWISGGTSSTTAGDFGRVLTGLPHFRQYWASSGRVAPHLAHPKRTLVTGGIELLEGILTGCSHFNPSANPEKIFGAHMSADISTGFGESISFGNDLFTAVVPCVIHEAPENPASTQPGSSSPTEFPYAAPTTVGRRDVRCTAHCGLPDPVALRSQRRRGERSERSHRQVLKVFRLRN